MLVRDIARSVFGRSIPIANAAFGLVATLAACQLNPAAAQDDWGQFRGQMSRGESAAENVPTEWSADESIAWRVPLERSGNGSPAIVGELVLIAGATGEKAERKTLAAYRVSDGSLVWEQVCDGPVEATHETNPSGGTTPASDGETVVVWHGTAGLFAYRVADGEPLWSRQLGTFEHMWGQGTSPIIVGDRVILSSGPSKQEIFVAAFDLASGETLWRHVEPMDGDGETNTEGKYMGSWSSPVPVEVEGTEIALVSLPTRVVGFEVATGKLKFWCEGTRGPRGDLSYSSPVISGDLCAVTGGYQGPSFAFRLGGSGDITESNRLWRVEQNPQSIGTGVTVDGYLYQSEAGPGIIRCIDLGTGEVKWQQRASKEHWASVILAGGRCYALAQDGTTLVFEPNPERFIEIAENQLGEPSNSTPAPIHGGLIIRTANSLIRIGQ